MSARTDMPVLASRRIAAYRSTLDFGSTRAPSSCRAQPWCRSKHRSVLRTQRHHSPVQQSVLTAERQTLSNLTYKATLRFRHTDLPLGDIVLLWNATNPARMAVDLGTALERLAWARSRRPWRDLIFGRWAHTAPPNVLDALRTATLLLANGITPAARGAGSITRRVLATVPADHSPFGFSAVIRTHHEFWSTLAALPVAWPETTRVLEAELGARR